MVVVWGGAVVVGCGGAVVGGTVVLGGAGATPISTWIAVPRGTSASAPGDCSATNPPSPLSRLTSTGPPLTTVNPTPAAAAPAASSESPISEGTCTGHSTLAPGISHGCNWTLRTSPR